MYILGLSSYAHESSCALIKDGVVCCLIEEERLNREKHTWKFPRHAIAECLKMEGITFKDIHCVTFYWNPVKEITGNLAHVMRYFPQSLNLFKGTSGSEDLGFFQRVKLMRGIGRELQKSFDLSRPPKIHFIEHHPAHAASAFFVSPFEEAAILTMDGRGESVTTLLAKGQGNHIMKLHEIKVPHSLGHLYAAFTDYLGFRPFFDEWKVMGLSAYGKDTYVRDFEKLLSFCGRGEFKLNLEYFRFHTHGQRAWLSEKFIKEFGAKRKYDEEYDQRTFDIAFALQHVIERAGVRLAQDLYDITRCKNLCMTGGVVLNCLMNKRIVEESPFENFFFQPVASDAGTSLGSALYYYHQILDKPRHTVFRSAYLGHEFTNDQIEVVLKEKGAHYRKSENIARDTARCIADGKIVGWFQGRMEAGPRALGNRSITVDPTRPEMKDRLNARVKKREFFRPFAPSVKAERAAEYFILPKGQMSPFMILIADVVQEKKSIIPAVTHADGTARVHTVEKDDNPLYWQLIDEFEKLTGVPVLLNTSFNENEPIVATPAQAVDCFLRTEFDCLAIGDFLVTKEDGR
jgi:carbamoyltransferase